jgi:hypothetical protein
MGSRCGAAFALLIVAQVAHSSEEFAFRLFDVLAPARFLSGLVSSDLATGFLVLNAAVVSFGVWCYVARVRPGHPSARAFAWVWVVVELANGVGHMAAAVWRASYFPGVATAPVLAGISLYLGVRLAAEGRRVRR